MVMVYGAKDMVVPLEEVCLCLVEEMEFGQKEAIEVSEHEGRWWLLGWGEVGPIEVGLDGAILVRVAEIRGEGGWVSEG